MLWLVRSLLFLAVLGFGASRLTDRIDARFASLRTHADAECRAFRAAPRHADADVCREYDAFGGSSVRDFQKAKASLDMAKRAFATGNAAGAHAELERALDIADRIDERSTILAALAASRLVADALDLIEAQTLPAKTRRDLLSRMELSTAEAPLEGERVHRGWHLISMTASDPFARWATVKQMPEDVLGLVEMEHALRAGDIARCERATPPYYRVHLGASFCTKMRAVVQTGQRLKDDKALANHESQMEDAQREAERSHPR